MGNPNTAKSCTALGNTTAQHWATPKYFISLVPYFPSPCSTSLLSKNSLYSPFPAEQHMPSPKLSKMSNLKRPGIVVICFEYRLFAVYTRYQKRLVLHLSKC